MSTQPLILAAAQKGSPYLAARTYAALGMSVLPCIGKKPAGSWKQWTTRIPPSGVILEWQHQYLWQNVGIICGAVSGNLVVIDLDGRSAVHHFKQRFPELFNTYAVSSGSGEGMHLYFYVRDMPQNRRASWEGGNIEIRGDGCYVIAPPSIHPSGRPYRIAFANYIVTLDNLHELEFWLLPKQVYHRPEPVGSVSAWAQAALTSECHAVVSAPEGSRNDALNRAAFKLGQLVGSGQLNFALVESHLRSAAAGLAATDGEKSVVKTIHSGLMAGMQSPRELS